MAKRVEEFKATEGRDAGKVFILTEMPATQAAWWADRFLLSLGRGNLDIPPELAQAGMYGVFVLGLRMISGMPWGDAKTLLDELMACVQWQNANDDRIVRKLVDDDIEEVKTIYDMRAALFKLHVGFSMADALSKWMAEKAPAEGSQTTQTSPA